MSSDENTVAAILVYNNSAVSYFGSSMMMMMMMSASLFGNSNDTTEMYCVRSFFERISQNPLLRIYVCGVVVRASISSFSHSSLTKLCDNARYSVCVCLSFSFRIYDQKCIINISSHRKHNPRITQSTIYILYTAYRSFVCWSIKIVHSIGVYTTYQWRVHAYSNNKSKLNNFAGVILQPE